MFQFSLRQPWVLGTMKVVWLLAVFIAIVTYTPWLTWSGAGYAPGKRLQTESAVSKVTHVGRDKVTP